MPKNLRFWSNVTLIALVHVALVVGLIRWSRASSNASAQSVVWLNGGGGDGVVTEKKNPPVPVKSPLPRKESKTESLKEPEPVEDRPYLASAPSDIQLPTPKPSPISTPNRAHTPKAKATPTPKPKPTPKPTPTASPARTPSPKKIVLAKASPKPSPKLKPTPPEKDQSDEERTVDSEKKKAELATQTGSGKGPAPGAGAGRAGGAGSESQFGWYGSMLHDRFYSEWVQPTTVATAGAKNSVLVKLRIEKDGRVSSFEVVRPSGNPDLDESVKMLANRVSRVDPLPDGLGKGDHYDVKINFELNSE
ncbi:MAG: colicin import rane protein [Verrucomicrobiota bacterium]|jgi:TonB family protein